MYLPVNPHRSFLPKGQDWDPSMIQRYADDLDLHMYALAGLTYYPDKWSPRFWEAIESLTPGQRMLVSTAAVENHVNQGGFQKLWFYDPWALTLAIDGYRLIGAERVSLLLETVARTADWSTVSNADRDEGCPSEEFDTLYYALDNLNTGYRLDALKRTYIKSHPEQFPRGN